MAKSKKRNLTETVECIDTPGVEGELDRETRLKRTPEIIRLAKENWGWADRSPETEKKVSNKGIRFDYRTVPMDQIDHDESRRNSARLEEPINHDNVTRMIVDAAFDPPAMTPLVGHVDEKTKLVVVGHGHNRLEVARVLDRAEVRVMILIDGKPDDRRDLYHRLNLMNGMEQKRDDNIRHAVEKHDKWVEKHLGQKMPTDVFRAIAGQSHITPTTLRQELEDRDIIRTLDANYHRSYRKIGNELKRSIYQHLRQAHQSVLNRLVRNVVRNESLMKKSEFEKAVSEIAKRWRKTDADKLEDMVDEECSRANAGGARVRKIDNNGRERVVVVKTKAEKFIELADQLIKFAVKERLQTTPTKEWARTAEPNDPEDKPVDTARRQKIRDDVADRVRQLVVLGERLDEQSKEQ